MDNDRPLLGIPLILGFCALAPFADALAKLLGPEMGVGQLVTLRFAFQAAILLPIAIATRRPMRMSRKMALLVIIRTLLHIAGVGTVVTSLLYLPLADAIAIAYVMPFIMLRMGHYILGEEVGWRRLAACVAGFAGTGAHLLMTWSLRFAPASTLAPMQYLELPMATLIGWALFQDLPGPLAALGIAITIASGVYVVMCERATYRARPPAPPAVPQAAPPAG